MGTIAENKKTIDQFKNFNSSILTQMLDNNPEIYSAFAKVLNQVEKKYFTGSQKQWTLDDFKDTKIIVDTPEKSIRLQGLLLDLGAEWGSDDVREEYKRKLVNHTDQKYLVINNRGGIYFLSEKHNWDSSGKEERFYYDIFPEETATKQWTLDDFKDTKIIVDTPEKSKRFQELVLSLGAEWTAVDVEEGSKRKSVNNTDEKYLLINNGGGIYYLLDKDNWRDSSKEERIYEEIFPEEIKTRKWTLEDFDDTKIILNTPEKSKRFQELLLSLGCEWNGLDVPDENLRKSVNLTDKKYLSIIAKDNFMVVASIESFNRFSNKEIFYEEIFPEETATKQWTLDDFKNTKITVDTEEKSKRFQELLFSLGGKWSGIFKSEDLSKVKHLSKKYLGIRDSGALFFLTTEEEFKTYQDQPGKEMKEIFYDDIFPEELTTTTIKDELANYRVKTEEELRQSYGVKWKSMVNWASTGQMDWLFGKPLTEVVLPENYQANLIQAQNNRAIATSPDLDSKGESWLLHQNAYKYDPKTQEKKWTLDDFNNTKILVDTPEKSERFQELMFSLGGKWVGFEDLKERSLQLQDKKYLGINNFGGIYYIDEKDKQDWIDSDNFEIFYEEIFPEETIISSFKDQIANYRVKTEEELEKDNGKSWESILNWNKKMNWLLGKPLTEIILVEEYEDTLKKIKAESFIKTSSFLNPYDDQEWYLYFGTYKYDPEIKDTDLSLRFKTQKELDEDGTTQQYKTAHIPQEDFNTYLGKPLSEIYNKNSYKNVNEAIKDFNDRGLIYLNKPGYTKGAWTITKNFLTKLPLGVESDKKLTALDKEYYLNSKIMVANPNQSVNLQRFFNHIGISWFSDGSIIRYDNAKFLMVDENGILGYTFDEVIFLQSKKKEILYKDILPFIKKTVLNPQKPEKQESPKEGQYKLSVETFPAKLELNLPKFEGNKGDRKSPSQSAGDLKTYVMNNSKKDDYLKLFESTKFKGNDDNWYKINISKAGTWTWKKA